MKEFLNHNDTSLKTIEKYVLNQMSSEEKNAFEKQMLNDAFLKEAVEGYQAKPDALNYFKTHLNKNKTSFFNLNFYILVGLFVIIISYLFWQNKENEKISQTAFSKNSQVQNQIDIMPIELETLTVIPKTKQIDQTKLIKTQKNKKQFETVQLNENITSDTITHIDIPITDIDDTDQIITTVKTQKKIYPTDFFYDLQILDYRIFEPNRKSTINKKTYIQTGLTANFENKNAQNKYDLVEKEIQVSYVDYLNESMAYFSKDNFKKALQRYTIILEQYPNDFNALFYGGLSNYNLGRYQNALRDFNQLIEDPNQPFYEDALWYSTQIQLKLNRTKEAKMNLEKLILESDYYRVKAIKLLKTLQ